MMLTTAAFCFHGFVYTFESEVGILAEPITIVVNEKFFNTADFLYALHYITTLSL